MFNQSINPQTLASELLTEPEENIRPHLAQWSNIGSCLFKYNHYVAQDLHVYYDDIPVNLQNEPLRFFHRHYMISMPTHSYHITSLNDYKKAHKTALQFATLLLTTTKELKKLSPVWQSYAFLYYHSFIEIGWSNPKNESQFFIHFPRIVKLLVQKSEIERLVFLINTLNNLKTIVEPNKILEHWQDWISRYHLKEKILNFILENKEYLSNSTSLFFDNLRLLNLDSPHLEEIKNKITTNDKIQERLKNGQGKLHKITITTHKRIGHFRIIRTSENGGLLSFISSSKNSLVLQKLQKNNWNTILELEDKDDNFINTLYIEGDKKIYIGTLKGKLYYSDDNGNNWQELETKINKKNKIQYIEIPDFDKHNRLLMEYSKEAKKMDGANRLFEASDKYLKAIKMDDNFQQKYPWLKEELLKNNDDFINKYREEMLDICKFLLNIYQNQNQRSKQIMIYNKMIQFEPNNAEHFVQRGRVYENLKEFKRAQTNYENAIRLLEKNYTKKQIKEGTYAYYYYNLGDVYFNQKLYEKAIEYYDKASIIDNTEPYIFNQRGRAYDHLEQYDNALKNYKRALKLDKEYYYAYNNMGVVYESLGEHDKAIKSYKKALKTNPQYALSHYNLANVYKNIGEYSKALKEYNNAIKINEEYADAWFNKGYVLDQLRRYNESYDAYTKALLYNPNDAIAYNNRGYELNRLNRYQEAIENFDKALEINNEYALAYYNKGLSYKYLDKLEIAVINYKKATEYDPDYVDAWFELGYDLGEIRRFEEAIVAYTKVLELRSNYPEAYNNRGFDYSSLGQYKEAINNFLKAIKIRPNYAMAHYNMGHAYGELEEYEKAVEWYTKAIKIDNWYRDAYKNRGHIRHVWADHLRSTGKYDEAYKLEDIALKDFDKVLELDADSESAYYYKACIAAERGQKDLAFKFLKKSIELQPKNKKWARSDDNFESLHNDARWDELIGYEDD